ncbi:DxFTY motif-containing membrane protein [Spiroplasma platyhelix]|uniref:Transmembrane protein n=1 Tax=Spiroplasma platyhelix PALS-1 TaxID=1276218 RepID=A0A846TW71_9MOLU|nr:hypothetical protein [Spiroplasma platyhelix]MBE4704041.1 hypothetical protein [Spiroplasma platyhelix PALS-1]NKE38412.1 hypothetical protein [Spiroplasma platyhelix PALS-1]UJB29299.1 hypothetical protein SPLAT_v1c05350 [Spiroplasma platyhelix PALS-1]
MNENNVELVTENSNFESQPLKRTNFFVSFCYLIGQVLVPGLLLFFLTSKDFNFTFKLPLWLMVVLSLALLLFALSTTFVTYKLKLHQLDQFTYIIPFACFIIGLYLTSYWLDYHYFLIRFIIAFACAVVGIFLASMVLLIVVRGKKKIKKD